MFVVVYKYTRIHKYIYIYICINAYMYVCIVLYFTFELTSHCVVLTSCRQTLLIFRPLPPSGVHFTHSAHMDLVHTGTF